MDSPDDVPPALQEQKVESRAKEQPTKDAYSLRTGKAPPETGVSETQCAQRTNTRLDTG